MSSDPNAPDQEEIDDPCLRDAHCLPGLTEEQTDDVVRSLLRIHLLAKEVKANPPTEGEKQHAQELLDDVLAQLGISRDAEH
jgi:hypothetical protein